MTALSIDTATNICAVAISDMATGRILARISNDIGKGHAEILMELIEQCLQQANVEYRDIERVVATTGPGSFTGVRVGLSCARAIALALKIPVIGITNLQACAAHAVELLEPQSFTPALTPVVFVVLDARRDGFYFQRFHDGISCSEAMTGPIDTLMKSQMHDLGPQDILCGNGAGEFVNALLDMGLDTPNKIMHQVSTAPIETVAMLGMPADICDRRPEPLYLRGPDAKIQEGFAVARTRS